MLKLFEVSGFKNFSTKVTLDFSNVRDYQFNRDCVKSGLLKDIIVYGKNSTGKTNFGLAIFDIVAHLTSKSVGHSLYDNYLNVNTGVDVAEFHYVFSFDSDVVDYVYRKSDLRLLTYERLVLNEVELFEQDYANKTGNIDGLKELVPTLNWAFQGDESLIKYALNNTALSEDHPLIKMMNFVSNMLWFRNLDESRYIGFKTKSVDFSQFILELETLNEFQELLHKAGVGDKLCIRTDTDGKKKLYVDTPTLLPFWATASSGIKALYTFYYWYKTAPDVSFLFVDEFDAYYHYELSEIIVELLEQMKDTQVVLTSHNTNLLTNRIMRPDCYMVLTKEKITSFADATKRELREGHNLEKLYMRGEFNG